MSMRYYEITKWEEICVEDEYNQYMRYTIARAFIITNIQQLTCKSVLNNFAFNIWPNNCVDKLLFLVKWRLKLAKQGAKIMSVDELWQILKPECILDTSSLKPWADNLVAIFTNAIKTNPVENLVENPIQLNNRQRSTWPYPAIDILCPVPATPVLAIPVPMTLVPATLVPTTPVPATPIPTTTDSTTIDIPRLALTTSAWTISAQPTLLIEIQLVLIRHAAYLKFGRRVKLWKRRLSQAITGQSLY